MFEVPSSTVRVCCPAEVTGIVTVAVKAPSWFMVAVSNAVLSQNTVAVPGANHFPAMAMVSPFRTRTEADRSVLLPIMPVAVWVSTCVNPLRHSV